MGRCEFLWQVLLPRKRPIGWNREALPTAPIRANCKPYLTSINSMSNIKVAFGGMTLPKPAFP